VILIVDCYLDPAGGTHNFSRQLGGRPFTSVRPTRAALPAITDWSAVFITGSGASLADGYEGQGLRDGWTRELIDWTRDVVNADVPVFGACFGHQVLGAAFGDGVRKARPPEVGFKTIRMLRPDPLFAPLGTEFMCFVSHEDEIAGPGRLTPLASTPDCALQAVRVPDRRAWGVQFHAEMLQDEARDLLRYRKAKHPELDVDLDAELAQSHAIGEVAPVLFGEFLRQAGA
jgi:GMP synthase (glutamine-hydrolysing)